MGIQAVSSDVDDWRYDWRRRYLTRQALIAAALLLGVGCGLAVALFGQLGSAGVAALSLMLIGTVIALDSNGAYRDWPIIGALLLMVLISTLQKSTGLYFWGIWQAALFGIALLGVWRYFDFSIACREFRLPLVLMAAFLLVGLVASLYGRSRMTAFLYQFISDLKPLLMVALGFVVLWTPRTEAAFWALVRWLWFPSLLLVAFEWGAPGAYQTLFPARYISGDNFGLFPSRAMGLFEHPSFLATTSALLAVACAARALQQGERIWRYAIPGFFYVLLIVCSVQRQEFVAALAAIVAVMLLQRPQRLGQVVLLATPLVLLLLGVFALLYWETLLTEAASWGFGGSGVVTHPRAQILTASIALAGDYFPLGSGLGTFGGAGAEKFDQSLYRDLGFGRYWWFGQQDYLMDMYWPNSIGETGFIGALLLLAAYVAFIAAGCRLALHSRGGERCYWAMFAAGMAYVLLLSMSSPAYQDPRLTLLASIWAGVAVAYRRRTTDAGSAIALPQNHADCAAIAARH